LAPVTGTGHRIAWLVLLGFLFAAVPPWAPPSTTLSSGTANVVGLEGPALVSLTGPLGPASRGWKRGAVPTADLPDAARVDLVQQRLLPSAEESMTPSRLPEPSTVLRI
jgi:hypothetical protein